MIVGGFGSFQEQTTQGCGSLGGTNFGCVRPDRQIAGGARVGYVIGDKLMVYGKGAYVNTLVKATFLVPPNPTRHDHHNVDGWRAGGGVEYALNRHVYLKAEYMYARTSRFDAQPFGFGNTRISYHQQYGTGGVGIRF